ncbi:PREDICTED: protein HOTHEAD-like [Nelumbo nucifera]|uniref:Protein HOTHEAD-like n=2 Tax=Nelumbo nucifera TaxID=4432 RepID=A0A1U8BFJ7_NELNU|nr:PREDICTED: protein HOTHEAD-like [Nelumbo nucifera]DAD18126.1 TPA_asm: hypothetical protein HUJ06_019589 [Nelumbo nucifera]
MELQEVIHLILSAFYLLIVSFSSCSLSVPEGDRLPYMTSDIREASGKSFDYIIVGGGASGCPLAATLSERFSVLLVERGGSPYGDPFILEKKNYGLSLIQTDEYSSVAQRFVSEEGVANLRGRVLGGSTAINGGFYSRASESYIKRVGWDEKLVRDAYEWVESKVVFKPELSLWQSFVIDGFVEAGILPFNGFSLKHVGGTKVGGSTFDEYGRRHTSADLLAAGNWKRLTVLLNATVKNVIFQRSGDGGKPRAQGIRFINSDSKTNCSYKAYLNYDPISRPWGDVILSAGTLSSPQILMLSGIGPRDHLKNFKIYPLVDANMVGKGVTDNPCIALAIDSEISLPPDPPQVVGIANGYQIIVQSLILPISFKETRVFVVAKLSFPLSRGTLELKTTDPRQNPSVKFNYLVEKRDMHECVKMARLVERVAGSKAMKWFERTHNNETLMSTNEKLREFCGMNVRTYYHYFGGCSVGSVVDKDYKVYGVDGLRVIDGSTLVDSPGTNPMATLLLLGRYQGIKILQERVDDLVNSIPDSHY